MLLSGMHANRLQKRLMRSRSIGLLMCFQAIKMNFLDVSCCFNLIKKLTLWQTSRAGFRYREDFRSTPDHGTHIFWKHMEK